MRWYLDRHAECRGKLDVPTSAGGVAHWWLLKEESRSRNGNSAGGNKGKKQDSRYGVHRGFGLLHRNVKHGYTEIYEPVVGLSFMREFGLTHLAKRLVVMYEPFDAEADEKRLHLVDRNGERFDIGEVQNWFSHPEILPKALKDAEAAAVGSSTRDKITSDDIKKWVKDAADVLPFAERIIASKSGEIGGDLGLGHGGSKETVKRKPGTPRGGSRTGSDKPGSGDADTNKNGPGEGTGRRISRRQARPLEDVSITLMTQEEFGEENFAAAEYIHSGPALNINRGYMLFDHMVKSMSKIKGVSAEQIEAELAQAVGKRLVLTLCALRSLSKRTEYGSPFYEAGVKPEALTAAVEAARADIFADMKRNLGRFRSKEHSLDA